MKTVHIDLEDITVGMDVTAHWKPNGYSGQGGEVAVVWPGHKMLTLRSGTARIVNVVRADEVHHWTVEVPFDADECLNFGPDCSGPVDWWHSGGMNGRSWPRCTFHGERRLRSRETSLERYADSDVSPFNERDLAECGERWDDDY